MSGSGIKISVVIPAYQSAGTIGRLVESLDARTLPQHEFEVVVVDDGSTDGTSDTVRRLQESRPNLVSKRIEASGWASRPRNVGLEIARGDYVLFMDSDDTLYPDGVAPLPRVRDGARLGHREPEGVADQAALVRHGLLSGERAESDRGAGITGLLPMTPHKLFRRAFLLEHGLRFQESEAGQRVLWEDVRLMMEAYRHARVVSVLADTAVYHWHSNAGSISKSYGARTDEFWDQVERLLQFIHALFADEEFVPEREAMLIQQYKVRLLGRFCTLAATAGVTDEELAMPFARLRGLQQAYLPLPLDEQLGVLDRSRAALARDGRLDLLQGLIAVDKGIANSSAVTHVEWRGPVALVTARTTWTRKGGPVLEAHGDRIVRAVPEEIAVALRPELVDVTDSVPTMVASVWIRDPERIITWPVPATSTKRLVEAKAGSWTIEVVTHAVLDLRTVVFGRPLDAAAWELWIETAWIGALRRSRMRFKGKPVGVLQPGPSPSCVRTRRASSPSTARRPSDGRSGSGVLRSTRPSAQWLASTCHFPRWRSLSRPKRRRNWCWFPSNTVAAPPSSEVASSGHRAVPRSSVRATWPADGTGSWNPMESCSPAAPPSWSGTGGRVRIPRSAQPWNRARVAAAIRRRLAARLP